MPQLQRAINHVVLGEKHNTTLEYFEHIYNPRMSEWQSQHGIPSGGQCRMQHM